jgi:alpha-beta hydrolase superfamily lysophospholipase
VAGFITFFFVSLQDRFIYFPDKADISDLESASLRPWPSPDDFRGLIADPPGQKRGTVVVFHGNAGHAGHRGFYAEKLKSYGLRVILAEYPAYGPRDGHVGESNFVEDASDILSRAYAMYGAPLLVIGESLGSGVAAAAVGGQRDKVAGLLMITPWNRLEDVATYHFPWLPVRWLLRDKYDSERSLRGFTRPVAVLVAERDRTVPPTAGRALYEALSGPKRLTVVNGADHNDWQAHVAPDWWPKTIDFLLGP